MLNAFFLLQAKSSLFFCSYQENSPLTFMFTSESLVTLISLLVFQCINQLINFLANSNKKVPPRMHAFSLRFHTNLCHQFSFTMPDKHLKLQQIHSEFIDFAKKLHFVFKNLLPSDMNMLACRNSPVVTNEKNLSKLLKILQL